VLAVDLPELNEVVSAVYGVSAHHEVHTNMGWFGGGSVGVKKVGK
jgi:hypothetical protein